MRIESAHSRAVQAAADSLPTDSPWLITVPLIILGFLAVVAGYLNAAALQSRTTSSIGSNRRSASRCPKPAEFKWVNALPSIAPGRRRVPGQPGDVQAGVRYGRVAVEGSHRTQLGARCRSPVPGQQVLPRRPVREGHRPRHRPPDRCGCVLDQPARHRRQSSTPSASAVASTGDWVYKNIDQRVWSTVRSTAVVPSPAAPVARCSRCNQARSTCTERCCSVAQQSVRSYSYSSTARGTTWNVLQDQQWLLSLGTFLPLAGVLVMLFIPKRDEALIKGIAVVTALATLASACTR